MTKQLETAYAELLKLRLETARHHIMQERQQNPDNRLCEYFDNYVDVAELLVTDDRDRYNEWQEREAQRLDSLDHEPDNSPYFQFVRAEIKLQWAFVKIKFGDEVSAAWNIRQAYKLLVINTKKHPQFLPQRKSLGILQILISSVPEKYQWVMRSIGFRTDLTTGKNNLQKATTAPHYFGQDAQTMQALMMLYVLHEPAEAIKILAQKQETAPDNLLACFLYGNVLVKQNRSEEALRILLQYPKGKEYPRIFVLNYLLGEIYLQKGDYDLAVIYLNYFLAKHKGNNYLKDSYFKLFLAFWLRDMPEKAKPFFDKIATVGRSSTEPDQYAQRIAASNKWPNAQLMRVRLASDGGFYAAAFAELYKIKYTEWATSQPNDYAEYHYRAARLYHLTADTTQAIRFYQQTIAVGSELPHYFAANSALQLGYLYRAKYPHSPEACQYFKRALSFRQHEYKNSIDNKAKIALAGCR